MNDFDSGSQSLEQYIQEGINSITLVNFQLGEFRSNVLTRYLNSSESQLSTVDPCEQCLSIVYNRRQHYYISIGIDPYLANVFAEFDAFQCWSDFECGSDREGGIQG